MDTCNIAMPSNTLHNAYHREYYKNKVNKNIVIKIDNVPINAVLITSGFVTINLCDNISPNNIENIVNKINLINGFCTIIIKNIKINAGIKNNQKFICTFEISYP